MITSSSVQFLVAAALACSLATGAGDARAQAWKDQTEGLQNETPAELQGVDIVEHLGGSLPRDAVFRDTEGKPVALGDFFDGKRPTLFVFAYHSCPMLCSLVLDAAVKSLNEVSWTVGREFDVVSVSIDPRDTPETATRKEPTLSLRGLLAKYGTAPSAEEIDQNRAEMFANFPRSDF